MVCNFSATLVCKLTVSPSIDECSLKKKGQTGAAVEDYKFLKWFSVSVFLFLFLTFRASDGLRVRNWKGNSVRAIVLVKINDAPDTEKNNHRTAL